MKAGKVYLVGAGPGDPGLITRKALECLARAEVIIYDRLIGGDAPDLGPAGAERIYVGKSSGEHTLRQDQINRLLVEKAREGKIVVRLKGGDPFVLGRGGEEAETLAGAGIPFEIVPGITSAIAVPAYAGIPVTQRGVASSFAVITGHEDPAKGGSSIAWDKLATAVDTLVFLMGMKNLAAIVEKLISAGRPAATTPVAVIKDGTTPRQQTVTGTLADIVSKVEASHIEPPAVVVVGDVVGLREKLRWFDTRPLFGKRILVTRARQQASTLARLLAERGAEAVELPAIEIRPAPAAELDRAVSKLPGYDWVVFTSANGVDAFFARLYALGRDARAFKGSRIAAIGPATAAALRRQGIVADLMPATFTTERLLETFVQRSVSQCSMLLARADIAEKDLSEGLRRLGNQVDEVAAYVTTEPRDSLDRVRDLLASGMDVITFTSSSTVSNLMTALNGMRLPAGCRIACIGPRTAATAREAGLTVDILSGEQTVPGLVAAIEDYFRKDG